MCSLSACSRAPAAAMLRSTEEPGRDPPERLGIGDGETMSRAFAARSISGKFPGEMSQTGSGAACAQASSRFKNTGRRQGKARSRGAPGKMLRGVFAAPYFLEITQVLIPHFPREVLPDDKLTLWNLHVAAYIHVLAGFYY